MSKKMAVLLAEGFEESEAVVPMDIAMRAGIEVVRLSVSGEGYVKGAHGMAVNSDAALDGYSLSDCDLLMLPGGMPGTTNLESSPAVRAAIEEVRSHGGYLAAICAAPRMLGDMGLLDGVRATVYPGNEDHMKGADLDMKAKAVTDGLFITARGMGCAVEFGREIVTALIDAATAGKVLDSIQF